MPWKNLQRENIILHSLVFVFLLITYWPFIGGPFFTSDDAQLILIPQFSSPISWQNVLAIFTPGNHLDFYPVRDLSYLFDHLMFQASPFLMRLENLIILYIGYLYFFKLSTIFEIEFKIKALFSSVWLFSFYQLEQVMWLSARKDLLALTFAIISIYYFLKSESKLTILFYLLSLLSKATFGLLPIFYLFHFLFIDKDSKKLKLIIIALVIMLGNAIFQSWFYSAVTDMTYKIAFIDRFNISMSALGRMLWGMINYKVNSIDFFNFGDWLELNQEYKWIGFVFIFLMLLGFIYSLIKKNYLGFCFITLLIVLYLPISGLIFPHKMFYSTRYLIPIFTFLIIGLSYLINQRKIAFYILIPILIFNITFLRIDLENWKDNLSIRQKSASLHPNAIYPKTQLLLEMMNPSFTNNLEKFKLVNEIDQKCSQENNLSCLRYYLISKEIFKDNDINKSNFYWTKYLLTINLYQYNKGDILNHVVIDGLKSPYFPINKITEWSQGKKYFTTVEERIWNIFYYCTIASDANALKVQYEQNKLLNSKDFINYLDNELSLENQKLIKSCLKI